MRRILAALVCVLSISCGELPGLAPAARTASPTSAWPMGWKVFTEDAVRFRIAIPPTWVEADRSPQGLGRSYEAMTKGGLRYFAVDPNRNEIQLRVFADAIEPGRDVDSFARTISSGYERAWETVTASYAHVELRRQDAVRLMLVPSAAGTAEPRNAILQFYVVANGNWYLIEFHSYDTAMAALTPTFESIAATFLLLPARRAP
jgi:hypothetical protein